MRLIWQVADVTGKRAFPTKAVKVWRLGRGAPVLVATAVDTFVSDWQLLMDALQQYRVLPSWAFEVTLSNTYRHSDYSLAERGIHIHQLTPPTYEMKRVPR